MKLTLWILALTIGVCYGTPEVIKVTGNLSESTQEYIWPSMANGGVVINEEKIYIPNGSKIYVQSRMEHEQWSELPINLDNHNDFTIRELLINEDAIYINLIYTDGRFYIYKHDMKTDKQLKPVLKHGFPDRMLTLQNGHILLTGFYRPAYAVYLEKYDDETQRGGTDLSRRMFKELYEKHTAFSLSRYDHKLSFIDSANFLSRSGEDARAFEDLFVKHPIDLTEAGQIAIIDNSEGYTVELFDQSLNKVRQISIVNKNFKKIPHMDSRDDARQLRSETGLYSVAYALYVKGDLIITTFYGGTKMRDLPQPPYYYDVTSLDGRAVATGRLGYPIISEGNDDKVFLLVKMDGGWFEEDSLYLVGLTIPEIIAGMANKKQVESYIDAYNGNQ